MTTGVYVEDRLVHEYLNENYGLADVAEMLQIGTLDEGDEALYLTLDRKALTDLQNLSHAFSFDYDEGFVEMCQDLCRAAAGLPGATVTFREQL